MRKDLQIVFQDPFASLDPRLPIGDAIAEPLENFGMSPQDQEKRIIELLELVGLNRAQASKYPNEFSGGQRQRIAIARALALDPKFVLLDEPFAGVDPLAVGDIQSIIRRLKQKNIGVLITDHNVRETLGIVDRAYIMSQGELLVSGTPDEIINNEIARKFYLGEEFKM